MNFNLNVEDDIARQLADYGDAIIWKPARRSEPLWSIFIFDKANFRLTGVKGADFSCSLREGKKGFTHPNSYSWDYMLKKGDIWFQCGGNASFFPDLSFRVCPKINASFILGHIVYCEHDKHRYNSREIQILVRSFGRAFPADMGSG
jgi:hypothetical protein